MSSLYLLEGAVYFALQTSGAGSTIATMNETLVVLTNELKHTNEHLDRHEEKIEDIEKQPKARMQQILTAVISAVCGGLVSILIGMLV